MKKVNLKVFEKEIEEIKKSEMIDENDKILLAFSGGPDSMFMYYILENLKIEYGLELGLLYVNHNLREDVENDIKIVEKFSKDNGVTLYIENIDVNKYSKENKKSIELSARELRYEKLEKISKEKGYNKIATGHNLDDNVETLVFRLIRGSSLDGLKGIPQKRGNIIRPILNFEKKKIVEFLNKNNVKYVIDYTNFENDYTRNYIRNEIFPMFEKINENFRKNINGFIKEINDNEVKKNKNKLVKLLKKNNVNISREKINSIYENLYDEIDKLRENGSKEFDLGKNKILRKEYDKIIVVNKNEEYENPLEIVVNIGESIIFKDFEIGYYNYDFIKENKYGGKLYLMMLEEERLVIRNRKEGDKIYLKNLGYKKVKKILIDSKISKWERDNIPVISGFESGEILSVGDIRKSVYLEKFKDRKSEETKGILVIRRKNER